MPNMNRRNFIKKAGVATAMLFFGKHPIKAAQRRFTAKETIELLGGKGDLELLLHKRTQKPGAIYMPKQERSVTGVIERQLRKEELDKLRSLIHTHPEKALSLIKNTIPAKTKNKLISNFSRDDIMEFVGKISIAKNMRFAHLATININGKVIGYSTLMVPKKLAEELRQNPLKTEELITELRTIIPTIRTKEGIEKEKARLEEFYKKYGFVIRRTPMPGYIYKEQIFVKK